MFIVKVPGINSRENSTNGCEKSGNALIESLKGIHGNEQSRIIDAALLDLEEIHLDNSRLEMANNLIYKNAGEIFDEKPKTIFLGGDHSISYPLVKAFFEFCGKNRKESCLIIFDSRPNCMKNKGKFPTNDGWLRSIVESGFPAGNVMLVGARNQNSEEIEFINKNRIKNIGVNPLLTNIEDTCDTIMEFSHGKELYLSIDMGVVDPVFAPSATFQDCGGLSPMQLIYLIQRISRVKGLAAVDIVEINPEREGSQQTIALGAKILSELI